MRAEAALGRAFFETEGLSLERVSEDAERCVEPAACCTDRESGEGASPVRATRAERAVRCADTLGRADADPADARGARVERARCVDTLGLDVPADRDACRERELLERRSFERRLSLRPATYLLVPSRAETNCSPMAVTSPAPMVIMRSPSPTICIIWSTTSMRRGT